MRGARISQKLDAINPSAITELMKTLHSPKVRLAQIELLVCSAAFLLIFLVVAGEHRRRCNSRKLRAILWSGYTIPPYLITYTIGLMSAAPVKNELFPIWGTFLMMLLGSGDSISAYHFEDNKQWKRYSWQLLIKMVALAMLVTVYAKASVPMVAIGCLYFVALVKVSERSWASFMASEGNLRAAYARMEYLKNDHDEVDLTTMKGYDYVISTMISRKESIAYLFECPWKKKVTKLEAPNYYQDEISIGSPRVITVEKVWRCQGKLLSAEDRDHRLKDISLSFALSHILITRFTGQSIPKEVCQKSWKLFEKIIKPEENIYDCERAFRLIEVELEFVFHRFYTKYPFFSPFGVLKLVNLVFTTVGSCIVASTLLHHRKPEENGQLITLFGISIDVLVTFVVIITVVMLEISQIFLFCFSNWGKVNDIASYVFNEQEENNKYKYFQKLNEVICRIPTLKPWERKLHQYCLLESYGHSPSPLLYNFVTAMFVDQENQGQIESAPIELSEEVKTAVGRSIVTNGTKLENGKASLRRNGKEMLSWACDLETQAHVIMVWHIATTMCEYKVRVNACAGSRENFKTATSLSKYLAYLVAFAPRLLPDHPYVTEHVFDQVILEARDAFSEYSNLRERVRELMLIHIHSPEESQTVIERGARLGRNLIEDVKDPDTIWKVLANFWSEFMVYVAPSNDINAHVDHLTMGGEFVTHIWALLSHSGIERESHETPKQEPSHETPKQEHSHETPKQEPSLETPKMKRSQSWS